MICKSFNVGSSEQEKILNFLDDKVVVIWKAWKDKITLSQAAVSRGSLKKYLSDDGQQKREPHRTFTDGCESSRPEPAGSGRSVGCV